MNAKEMFDEKGWRHSENHNAIEYTKNRLVAHDTLREEKISFSKKFIDTIQFYSKNIRNYEEDKETHTTIEAEILPAIKQQIKELKSKTK
jgi:hypothetical protein